MAPKSSKMTLYKLVVLGDGGVGKTSSVIQLCLNHFVETYDPTIEDSYRKQVHIDGESCMLEVLDTAGQEEYAALRDQWIRDGEGFLLMYSISSRSTFTRISIFHQQIMRVKKTSNSNSMSGVSSISALDSPIICLVGNKADRVTEREVSTQEGFALANELGCIFVESSAKNCANLEKSFFDIVRMMRRQRQLNQTCEQKSLKKATEMVQMSLYQDIPTVSEGRRTFTSLFRSPKAPVEPPRKIDLIQQAALNWILIQASRRNKHKTVKRLLAMGADPNGHSDADGSALFAATRMGHVKMVKLLLNNGAAANALSTFGASPLEAAAIEGHSSLIKLLLDRGASIDSRSFKYGGALLAATSRSHLKAVQILIRRGANVNGIGGPYGNALQAAAWIGDESIARLLLDSGAEVNARGEGNCTALQAASCAGKTGVVRLLLLRGANLSDSVGKYGSALKAANDNSHFEVMKLLYEFGAKDEDLGAVPHGQSSTDTPTPGFGETSPESVTEQFLNLDKEKDGHFTSPRADIALAAGNNPPGPPSEPIGGQILAPPHLRLLDHTTCPAHEESQQWLSRMMGSDFNRKIISYYRENDRRQPSLGRIKVAILDTGYDSEAVFFNRARNERIAGWKDWADDELSPQDQNGHGTHVMSLFMKTCPYADVFAARIAKGTDDIQGASDCIAKAITWAVNEWNVDVISMSFGFSTEILVANEPAISNAILQAVQKRNGSILFFAAAANFGGNQKEMFPANHEFVIPIRGTNSQGVFQDFNPPPDRDGPAVFGTLGKDVPSAWLSTTEGEMCKSGTSVATPIAAGIAAAILTYASLYFASPLPQTPNPVRKLWTRHGMLSMFSKTSTSMEPRCFYLSPWEFIQKSDEERQAMITVAAGDG